MELATIFLIWLVVTIIDNLANRKKRRLPPPENPGNAPSIEIPTLANDPNFPGEEVPIVIENPRQAEIRPREFTPPTPPKKIAAQEVREAAETNQLNLNLTPSTVMNAFVLSEIISKPKALRRC